MAAAIGVTLALGMLAGLYPAVRAGRLPPATALGG
jgi:putative ABC transport system permease protein